jgi:hypothetical protein
LRRLLRQRGTCHDRCSRGAQGGTVFIVMRRFVDAFFLLIETSRQQIFGALENRSAFEDKIQALARRRSHSPLK